jgi:Thioredoxin
VRRPAWPCSWVCGWASRRALGLHDHLGQRFRRRLRHRRLDQREHLALLEAHVTLERRAELVQRFERRLALVLEPARSRADANVVDEHSHDARLVRVAVIGERGQQHILLDAEVRRSVLAPEREERFTDSGHVVSPGATQAKGDGQRDVVVARERLEGGVSLHHGDGGIRGSPRELCGVLRTDREQPRRCWRHDPQTPPSIMSSRVQQKAAAREARLAAEAAERRRAARQRAVKRLGVIASLAFVVVVAAAVAGPGGDDPGAPAAPAAQSRLFDGIPQDGITLGSPKARAVLTEFADLQCPYCAAYARDVLPTVVERYVRTGRLRLELQVLTFLGEDSVRSGAMAAAAAQQDRLWTLRRRLLPAPGRRELRLRHRRLPARGRRGDARPRRGARVRRP